jgi:hypothetical protein
MTSLRPSPVRHSPHLFRLRIGRAAKPGLAILSLVYRATTGEAARTTHRLRLPR